METKLKISGFKCFNDDSFTLKAITVLTGSNGAGKSSLIQAILLARLAVEKNFKYHREKNDQNTDEWNDMLIPLNDGFQLKLGTNFDIIRDKESKVNEIKIHLDNESFVFVFPSDEENNTSIEFCPAKNIERSTVPFWRKKEFYYLHTERLGPRHSLEQNSTEFIHCGHQGEFTAQVIAKYGEKAGFVSAMIKLKSSLLLSVVNKWLDTICPNVSVSAVPAGNMSYQIKLTGNSSKSPMLATNIGFGISYALPIIVTGLVAKKDSLFIVENPEAHLHPKGQSNIGYFLGKVAEAGVRIIIETHSEHVVNGLRRAILESNLLKTSDANIYFFGGGDSKKSSNVELIGIEEDGSLNKFPKDFFDQVNQDLSEIIKLRIKKLNG
jgi:predicted ATPase